MLFEAKASETVSKMNLKTLQRTGHPQFLMCHAQAYSAVCVMYSCAYKRIATAGEITIPKLSIGGKLSS